MCASCAEPVGLFSSLGWAKLTRFCFIVYWTLFLTCTVFPVLTSLNWIYSPPDVSRSSIDRASLSSLALSDEGSHLCVL